MVATSGDVLLAPDALAALTRELIPLATLVTPNLPEAARLLGSAEARSEAEAADQARALMALGARGVLLKGGHGTGDTSVDIFVEGTTVTRFSRPRIATRHTHGTGCTLSAAIAAHLAQGVALAEAVDRAKTFVWEALAAGRTLGLGKGRGPVDHLWRTRSRDA